MVTFARPDSIPAVSGHATLPFRSPATLMRDAADLLDRLPSPFDSRPDESLEDLDARALSELVDEDPLDAAICGLAEAVSSQTSAADRVFAMSLW